MLSGPALTWLQDDVHGELKGLDGYRIRMGDDRLFNTNDTQETNVSVFAVGQKKRTMQLS
jgi:hypothetical protein